MLVCKRCATIGIETDATVYERRGRVWSTTTKTFRNPRGGICDQCVNDLAIEMAVDETNELDDWGDLGDASLVNWTRE